MIIKPTYDELEQRVKELEEKAIKYKQVRNGLQKSEKKYRLISEGTSDLIAKTTFSQKPTYTYISPSTKIILGYEPEELIGKSGLKFIHPGDRKKLIPLLGKYIEFKNKNLFSGNDTNISEIIEYRYKSKSGDWHCLQSTVNMIGDELLFISKDITEQKKAEERLKNSEEKYRILCENAPIGIYYSDFYGKFLYGNKTAEKVIGYKREELVGKNFLKLKLVNPEYLGKAAKLLALNRLGKSTGIEKFALTRKDGSTVIVEINTEIITINKEKVVLGMVKDITDRMQAAEALRENRKKLARAKKMESLGLLAGGVAHDLNNVLSGIVSYPELLLLQLPEDSQFRKAIKAIKKSGDRAVAIVQDLLTVARGVAIAKEPLNVNDLIGDYLHSPEFNKLKQFHPKVTVKINLDTDLLNISASHVHIRKVVMNLVSNASEAIKGSGNVTISTVNRYVDTPLRGYDEISVGEYVVLAVSDDGSGISSDDLERIFEPFYTKKVLGRSGTGLGLAVVWNVVQDHKGYIGVKSNKNGTTFELFFPITREEISGKKLSMPFKDLKGDGEKILVIDDVESQRDISCKMLETFGYKTKAVSSGEEAVEYLKENTVDLILLDMIMAPGINGRETYERIIKTHPNQKAIIVSGFAETDEVKETQKLGAGKYIKKPLTLEMIGIAIEEELKK